MAPAAWLIIGLSWRMSFHILRDDQLVPGTGLDAAGFHAGSDCGVS